MSGGSYNYAGWNTPIGEMNGPSRDDFYALLEHLSTFGLKAQRIANDLKREIYELEQKEKQVNEKFERFAKLLKVTELQASRDLGVTDVLEELNRIVE